MELIRIKLLRSCYSLRFSREVYCQRNQKSGPKRLAGDNMISNPLQKWGRRGCLVLKEGCVADRKCRKGRASPKGRARSRSPPGKPTPGTALGPNKEHSSLWRSSPLGFPAGFQNPSVPRGPCVPHSPPFLEGAHSLLAPSLFLCCVCSGGGRTAVIWGSWGSEEEQPRLDSVHRQPGVETPAGAWGRDPKALPGQIGSQTLTACGPDVTLG